MARVRSDYRETVSEFTSSTSAVGRCLLRNQAHGGPGDLLDAYAASDSRRRG